MGAQSGKYYVSQNDLRLVPKVLRLCSQEIAMVASGRLKTATHCPINEQRFTMSSLGLVNGNILCKKGPESTSRQNLPSGEDICTDFSAFTSTFLGIAPWFSFGELFLPNSSLCDLIRADVQAWTVNILHFFYQDDQLRDSRVTQISLNSRIKTQLQNFCWNNWEISDLSPWVVIQKNKLASSGGNHMVA